MSYTDPLKVEFDWDQEMMVLNFNNSKYFGQLVPDSNKTLRAKSLNQDHLLAASVLNRETIV